MTKASSVTRTVGEEFRHRLIGGLASWVLEKVVLRCQLTHKTRSATFGPYCRPLYDCSRESSSLSWSRASYWVSQESTRQFSELRSVSRALPSSPSGW